MVLARMTILAPSLAKAFAIAKPIPLEAPDIMAVLPFRLWWCYSIGKPFVDEI